jgi:hypothetical protein
LKDMRPTERACKDMADVCELAHKRTVRECRKKRIIVDCKSSMMCGDNDRHRTDGEDDDVHYTSDAQDIFNRHYDNICAITGI